MEDVLVCLSKTNIELAMCEEEEQAKSELTRTLAEDNLRMTKKVEKLIGEKRLLTQDLTHLTGSASPCSTPLKRTSSDGSGHKAGRDSLDTQADSPRFKLPHESSEDSPGLACKCRHLLANWDKFKQSSKLRKLVKRGFAKDHRAELWRRSIGNALHLQRDSLDVYSELTHRDHSEELTAVKLIPLDVRRTLTYLQTFQEDQPLHVPLKSLLSAFAVRCI